MPARAIVVGAHYQWLPSMPDRYDCILLGLIQAEPVFLPMMYPFECLAFTYIYLHPSVAKAAPSIQYGCSIIPNTVLSMTGGLPGLAAPVSPARTLDLQTDLNESAISYCHVPSQKGRREAIGTPYILRPRWHECRIIEPIKWWCGCN